MAGALSDLKLLTVCEAARRLRVHPDTLVRWCKKGKANPIVDSGGRRVFAESEVARLLGACHTSCQIHSVGEKHCCGDRCENH